MKYQAGNIVVIARTFNEMECVITTIEPGAPEKPYYVYSPLFDMGLWIEENEIYLVVEKRN